jgi:hypothetical protein
MTLFTTLFYNAFEYYMIVKYEKEQSWVQSMQNKPDSEFKVIKLNATLYTFIEDSKIEQVNENVVINNKTYHIFKKSIKDNVLNLYYLGQENQDAIDVNFKNIVDSQSDSSKSPIGKLIKNFNKVYIAQNFDINPKQLPAVNNVTASFKGIQTKAPISGYLDQLYSPPDFV